MILKMRDWINVNLAPILLFVFYSTEAYYKIADFWFGQSPNILKILKLIILLIICSYIIYYKIRDLIEVFILTFFFSLGQLALKNSFEIEVVTVYGKLIYPLLLLIFLNIFTFTQRQLFRMLKGYEVILVFNSVLILIGFAFEIYVFKTYSGPRFGFNGLLVTSATGSYFYIISLIYLLLKDREHFFKKAINILVFVSSLFIGTKALYFFIICFLVVYAFSYLKKNIRNIFLLFIITIGFFFCYVFLYKYGLFNEVRKDDGLITALLSFRDQLFYENTLPFINENWTFLNYLFGGMDNVLTKSQIDIIDVFYILGLIGGLIYFYCFLKLLFPAKKNYISTFLLMSMLLIACFAGNFFSYASVAIYIVILREFLKDYEYS